MLSLKTIQVAEVQNMCIIYRGCITSGTKIVVQKLIFIFSMQSSSFFFKSCFLFIVSSVNMFSAISQS